MKVVIMAGGEGSRLRPLTCDRPKPMVTVMNVPVMEHIINLLKKHSLTDIAVTLQYLPAQIKEYFDDGRDFGVNLHYFTEDTPLGTAGSVRNAASFLDETFLVISGDALTDFNLTKILQFHRLRGSIATLVLSRQESPVEYGVVVTDKKDKIVRFLEKPDWSEVFSDTVNTGIYVLEPEIFSYFEQGIKFDFSKDLFPLLMQEGQELYGQVMTGYWCDIGNLEQYRQAHRDFLMGKLTLELKEKEVEPGIWLGERTQIADTVQIEGPVVIGAGSRLLQGAVIKDYTVLGEDTIIEEDASLKRSILWKGCYIGKGAALRGSLLAKKVRVGEFASLYEGSVVGDCTVIEEHCSIRPNVKIWPVKRIEEGTCLNSSLIWSTQAKKTLFGREGVSGTVNLELSPETAVRLGAAYASLLREGDMLVLGWDNQPASKMLKDALAAGIVSAGVKVLDLDTVVTPATRQAVSTLKSQGGIHVQIDNQNSFLSRISFFDEQGSNLSRGWERKIEQIFCREDFRRLRGDKIGKVFAVPEFMAYYFQNLLLSIDKQDWQEAEFDLLWLSPSPFLYSYLTPFLQDLNCRVDTFSPAKIKNISSADLERCKDSILGKMHSSKAQLAFFMDDNAENLSFFDSKGNFVSGEKFTVFISLLLFQQNKGSRVAVPVTTPSAVDKLAEYYHGEVFRIGTSPAALMQEAGTVQRLLSFDALAAIIYLLDFCAREKKPLEKLLDNMPSFHLQEEKTFCSWKDKGRIMRHLIEENISENIELLDGIKVYHPEGWALILPDSEKPLCRVYGEAYSEEIAGSLTDMYIEKIKNIQEQEG